MTTSAINYPFKYRQHGQAMVEYAILLVLLVTLIMGGLELSVTVYHSKKTGDAAEAGANAWAEAIGFSKSSKATTLQNEDLQEQFRQALNIDTDEDLADRDADGVLEINGAASCSVLPSDPCPVDEVDADEIRPRLGQNGACKFDHDNDSSTPTVFYDPQYFDENFSPIFAEDLPIDITSCSNTTSSTFTIGANQLINQLIDDFGLVIPERYENHPLLAFEKMCTSEMDEGIEKIIPCRDLVDEFNTDTDNDGIQDDCSPSATPCPDGIDDLDSTFRILFVKKVNDDGSPITPAISNLRVSLGDHDPTTTDTNNDGVSNQFRHPNCNTIVEGNNIAYDNGLPQDGRIYLFNPLPIDITNCNGDDPTRNNSSRVSILVGGHTNNANPNLNVNGLPALNQAIYSQYSRVCVTLSGDANNPQITIVSCNNFATSATNRIWLKPPGKMCGAVGGTEVCPDPDDVENDGDLVISNFRGATGFYFFGHANDAARGSFQWLNTETPTNTDIYDTFRPAFQLVCNGASHRDFNSDAFGACFDGGNNQGSFALEVHTRYRAIFESFLTFGLQELTDANLAAYFYNPNGVGIADNVLVGATGSELGPLGANGRPTVKQFKDFRGCYRVDITPPDKIGEQVKTAVSSCN